MNNLLDNEEDDAPHPRDREITLGTSTVLGIFFALAILCAAFFGFGYSLGSKHTTTAVTANGDAVGARNFSTFKPAPGSPINSTATSYVASASAPAPGPLPAPARPAAAEPAETPEAEPVVKPPKVPPPSPAAPAASAVPVTPAAAPGAQLLVVQVAALSHQEDAELIRTTLERRGYTVSIRPDAQDKLLHVQVGPFTNRKDAETMRQKLLADGFNAYIK